MNNRDSNEPRSHLIHNFLREARDSSAPGYLTTADTNRHGAIATQARRTSKVNGQDTSRSIDRPTRPKINSQIRPHNHDSDVSDDESIDITIRRRIYQDGAVSRNQPNKYGDNTTTPNSSLLGHASSDDERVRIVYRGVDEDVGASQKSPNFWIDPMNPQDVTIHMSIPAQDDVEYLLEECSRFRRLGDFRQSLALFENQLEHLLDNRYILLQYGQCLFEAGQYSRLEALEHARWPSGPQDLLQLGWEMLLNGAEYIAQGSTNQRTNTRQAATALLRRKWPSLDSTEAQILAHVIAQSTSERECRVLGDWHSLYRHMLDQGMIWELKDLLQALLMNFGVGASMELLRISANGPAGPVSPNKAASHGYVAQLEQLCRDLENEGEDESLSFALLDILTTLALESHAAMSPGKDDTIEWCMARASKQSSMLVARDPDFVISRPYLRWCMAKIFIKDANTSKFGEELTFRGSLRGNVIPVGFTTVFPSLWLPMYSPVDEETPRWEPRRNMALSTGSGSETIRAILEVSKELGDLDMQVACLQEMIHHGEQPVEDIVDSLIDIWSKAGMVQDIRTLHLFRYTLAHTDAAREQLRRDILCSGEIDGRQLRIARCMILRALATTPREKEQYLVQAKRIQREHQKVRFEDSWNEIERRPERSQNRRRYSSTDRRKEVKEESMSESEESDESCVGSHLEDARERWELERAREQLNALRLAGERREQERANDSDHKQARERRWELERTREELTALRLAVERREREHAHDMERAHDRWALERAREEIRQLKGAERQGTSKAPVKPASRAEKPVERQDNIAIDRRLDAIKREVEGIENDIRHARQTNDTKRIDSLHHRMEELGMERYGLEQTRIRSEQSKGRRTPSWPMETDRLALNGNDNPEGNGETQEKKSNEANTPNKDGTETAEPPLQVQPLLLLGYPGYGPSEVENEGDTDGST
ncbi:hypothetical protein QBC41DRAFT_24961 [Cercophora samala]|uniref:Uncharacterized protein n=1 Tax=Cercophora samala TaxID=330535 RepID=A0AA40DFJ4_9PEZI|nr:hypothetical protein QBC41DRAFT_24961 [Cercophora samala]